SPALRSLRLLPSLRHTPRPTRITRTRSWLTTTTHTAPRAAMPVYRTPVTAAPLSPASSPVPCAVATGVTLATRLFSTTNRPALSLQLISLRAAAVLALAPGSPLTAASPGRLVLAFTTVPVTTASLATQITTHLLHFSVECTLPGMTSLRASRFAPPTPAITASLGPPLSTLPTPSPGTSRSPPTRLRAMFTLPGWTKAAVASPTTTSTIFIGPRTVATHGPTPTPAPASPDRA